MSGKKILVIGALSRDTINYMLKAPVAGQTLVADSQHKELGGHGGNAAISIYRASRPNPGPDGAPDTGDSGVDIQLIAGVPSKYHLGLFKEKLEGNGIKTDSIEILTCPDGSDPTEDNRTSTMESETGKTSQICSFDTSNQWPIERFQDIDTMCGQVMPDLVIVTMELKKEVVEQIIETVYDAGIEILLYASPGETITLQHYQKIKHLVCNEGDAAKMLGLAPEKVNLDTYADVCDKFLSRGVENVVIKLGADGAYYKNRMGEDGFASGYKTDRDALDQTGATTAFLGPYAVNYIENKDTWNLQAATERGNKASALFAVELGYDSAIPWLDEVDGADFEVLYNSIEGLRPEEVPKKRRGLRNREGQKGRHQKGHGYTSSAP